MQLETLYAGEPIAKALSVSSVGSEAMQLCS